MSELKWTPVPGYEICRDGSVLSHSTNWRGYGSRPLSWSDDGTGYPVVRMKDPDGRRRKFKVHQLVCRAFHGDRPSPKHEVRHLDGNPMNNSAENLCWGTRAENAKDRDVHNRTAKGERMGTARLREVDVIEIRRRSQEGETFVAISQDFPVSSVQIRNIVKRISWRSV